MREIKFRAWNVSTKEWLDEDFSVSNDGKILYMGEEESYDVPSEFILMQFTGLHSKSGKEIWEGDVVNLGGEVNFGVYYHSAQAGFYLKDKRKGMSLSILETRGEVIGDIWENPKLLK